MVDIAGRASRIGSDARQFGNRLVERTKDVFLDSVDDSNIGRLIRSSNLLSSAEPRAGRFVSGSFDSQNNADWRVRLSVPSGPAFKDSIILAPLAATNNSMVFPYTPNIYMTHSANYNTLQPTHSNYPFYVYQNSAVDQFTIQGEFTAENAKEGEYIIAVMHYLKSITKMSYGESSNKGAPPPVVRLNGYGDYVFKNVPVIVQQYNMTLPPDVDYIQVDLGPNGSWAPTKADISVAVAPIYSRDDVNKFSLDAFVSGEYLLDIDERGYL